MAQPRRLPGGAGGKADDQVDPLFFDAQCRNLQPAQRLDALYRADERGIAAPLAEFHPGARLHTHGIAGQEINHHFDIGGIADADQFGAFRHDGVALAQHRQHGAAGAAAHRDFGPASGAGGIGQLRAQPLDFGLALRQRGGGGSSAGTDCL